VVGYRLGRYEVVKALAKGVLTDLLLGRATGMEGFERYVAIKLLRSDRARQAGCFEAFVNEARLAAVLHHHNIVQVHDIGEDDGRPYFAMEYVHGVDLRTLLARLAKRNEQLPLQHVVAIIASVAAALHHAHEQRGADGKPLNIVHRDVSPSNVLVGFDGNVKVADFGIAKAAINQIHTDAGVLKGHAPYMSPEQCAGRPLDRRSDVFALGIVLYELATVRRLFKGANDFLTMSAVCNAEVPPPSQYRRDIPDELEKIMLKALARSPHERFYTAGDMSLALDAVASEVGVGASTSALAHYMRLQFEDVKEPWLSLRPATEDEAVEEDDDFSDVTEVDFDGDASGLAPPPSEAVHEAALPRAIAASKSSPIVAARTHALTPPAQQRVMPLPARTKGSMRPPRVEQPILRAATGDPIEHTEPTTNERTEAHTSGEVMLEPVIVRDSAMFVRPPVTNDSSDTAVVEPLSVTAKRMPRRRTKRPLWILLASLLAGGASFAAVMLTPGAEMRSFATEAIEPATSTMHVPAPAVQTPPVDAAIETTIEPGPVAPPVPVVEPPAPAVEPPTPPAVDMKLAEPAKPARKPTKRPLKKPPPKKR
jgi:serine/threonine protein kinase